MKKTLLCLLVLPALSHALDKRPWFTEMFEFHAIGHYSYDFFDKVDHASRSQNRTIHTHVANLGLEVTAPDTWNWELELELAQSTGFSFGYRSFALQARKLWLDDLCGDPLSLTTGIVYRDASKTFLKALSTPYHARSNFEINTSFGKEWCSNYYWLFHLFGHLALGQGTSGSSYLKADLFTAFNIRDTHQLRLYGESYFGLGSRTTVDTLDHNSWGKIRHRSFDLGASYAYCLGVYGFLRFDYKRRLAAKSYPEDVNFFQFTWDFPFCPL